MSYEARFHKIFIETEKDVHIYVISVDEHPSLMEAIASIMIEVPNVTDLLFAGTCEESNLEYFGPDDGVVEFELDGDLAKKDKDTIH